MAESYRIRRIIAVAIVVFALGFIVVSSGSSTPAPSSSVQASDNDSQAMQALEGLSIKGRAPKTDYTREQFGAGWMTVQGCDTRNIILNRDMVETQIDETCHVIAGMLHDPYTGKDIQFLRGSGTSDDVQIDHVVALSDAWQKGAQTLSRERRIELANDPLELLAVDGPANQQKSDGDAATWLPAYKPFRCQYVARQIAVKQKYNLWVTQAEYDAIKTILNTCPTQALPQK